jgi:hypothetical protein
VPRIVDMAPIQAGASNGSSADDLDGAGLLRFSPVSATESRGGRKAGDDRLDPAGPSIIVG